MADVGSAAAGQVFIGAGNGASGTFASIGTNSGLTAHGVLLAEGNSAFVATTAGNVDQAFLSNGSVTDPSFKTIFPVTVSRGGTGLTASGTSGNVLTSDGSAWVSSPPASSATTVLAYLNTGLSNATGDGTGIIPLIFDTALVNIGGNYNATTGIFTAPTAGNYMVACNIMFNNLGALHTVGEVIFNKPVGGDFTKIIFNPGINATSVTGYTAVYSAVLSGVVNLLAAQEFRIGVEVTGSTKTVGIQGASFGLETSLSIFKV